MQKGIMLFLIFFIPLIAQNLPDYEGVQNKPVLSFSTPDYAVTPEYHGEFRMSHFLEKMELNEKRNAQIKISLSGTDRNNTQRITECENLWNQGQFDDAIALLSEIEKDEPGVEISFEWRSPLQTPQSRWGSDTRIGTRDSIYQNKLLYDPATGNLFAILLREANYGQSSRWTVNISTDGGNSWNETFDWWAGYHINSISADILGNHCYVGLSRGVDQDQCLLYRFNNSDGSLALFNNGDTFQSIFQNSGQIPIKEVSICSNVDFYNNRLYATALNGDGQLKYFWFNRTNEGWTEIATNVTDAQQGLATCTNEGFTTSSNGYLFASYYSTSDSLKIGAINNGTWKWSLFKESTSLSFYFKTSIGAYHDTVICAFDYHGASTPTVSRYEISYDGGNSWRFGYISKQDTTAEMGEVTARRGGGLGAVYRHYSSPRQIRYIHRNYPSGLWDSPIGISDYQPYYNQSSIAYLDNHEYGVLYLSWLNPVIRGAYFDRTNIVTSIKDVSNEIINGFALEQNYPNPFNPTTTISYRLDASGLVKLEVYNSIGQKVSTLINSVQVAGPHEISWDASQFDSGIYFYRLTFNNHSQTKRMILLK